MLNNSYFINKETMVNNSYYFVNEGIIEVFLPWNEMTIIRF